MQKGRKAGQPLAEPPRVRAGLGGGAIVAALGQEASAEMRLKGVAGDEPEAAFTVADE